MVVASGVPLNSQVRTTWVITIYTINVLLSMWNLIVRSYCFAANFIHTMMVFMINSSNIILGPWGYSDMKNVRICTFDLLCSNQLSFSWCLCFKISIATWWSSISEQLLCGCSNFCRSCFFLLFPLLYPFSSPPPLFCSSGNPSLRINGSWIFEALLYFVLDNTSSLFNLPAFWRGWYFFQWPIPDSPSPIA